MRRTVITIAALLLAVCAVEGFAYWWMHPKPAGQGEPVLTYRPKVNAEKLKTEMLKEEAPAPAQNPPQSSSSLSASKHHIGSASTLTPLPEIVVRALPSLQASTGTAARIDRDDGVTIHIAFFEWDHTSTTNVLEAFKHLPDECLGSLGMTLTAHLQPRTYQVGGESISFDHSVFRDTRGTVVHSFKGIWVSGARKLLGDGVRGGVDQWRQIRWNAALKRFRPAHARVAQGAVRGITNSDNAWRVFEETMLANLTFEKL